MDAFYMHHTFYDEMQWALGREKREMWCEDAKGKKKLFFKTARISYRWEGIRFLGRCLMGRPIRVESMERPKEESPICGPIRQHVTIKASYHGQSL
jgi:hypothetical protein